MQIVTRNSVVQPQDGLCPVRLRAAGFGMSTHDSHSTTEAQADSTDALGLDVETVDPDELGTLVEQLTDRADVPDMLGTVLSTLVEQNERLRERVETLESDQEKTHDIATTAVGTAQANESRLDDVEEEGEKTRDIAKCAIAKAERADSDGEADDDLELSGGLKRSTSPLDFFANCREEKVKRLFVEEKNCDNTYRAIQIAQRWQEFASVRNDGERVFWTRDDVKAALTAHLNGSPHRETISRVCEVLIEFGSDDVEVKQRRMGRSQRSKQIIEMDVETARGLTEGRYEALDLLESSDGAATVGGVTPVVTNETGVAL